MPGLPNFAPPPNSFLTILLFFSALCWGRYSNARLVFPYLSLVAALAHPYQTQNTLLNTERSNLCQNHSFQLIVSLREVECIMFPQNTFSVLEDQPNKQTHWNCWSKRSPPSALFPCVLPSLIVSHMFPQITFLESTTIVTVGRSAEPSLPLVPPLVPLCVTWLAPGPGWPQLPCEQSPPRVATTTSKMLQIYSKMLRKYFSNTPHPMLFTIVRRYPPAYQLLILPYCCFQLVNLPLRHIAILFILLPFICRRCFSS